MDKAYCCLLLGKKDPKLELPPEGVHFWEQGEITAQGQKEQILQGLSKGFSGQELERPFLYTEKHQLAELLIGGKVFQGTIMVP